MIEFRGSKPLATVLRDAAEKRGVPNNDLIIIAVDVADHTDLMAVNDAMQDVIEKAPRQTPIVITSQVPPGWTRPWSLLRDDIFYQPHTIIKGREDECAYAPDVTVVGCADPNMPLPLAYQDYVNAFEAPVLKMRYESAELSKLALNYILAAQISAANALEQAAAHVGADWADIMPAVMLDKRIGQHAYIRPGLIGGHLPRDIRTVERLRTLQ